MRFHQTDRGTLRGKISLMAASGVLAGVGLLGTAASTHAVESGASGASAVTCSVGVGHTAVWARCSGTGYARLSYWCKTTPWGDTWQLKRTGYERVNGSHTISRECAYEAASPSWDAR
ncbi:hypothetical protein ACFWDI_08920 [Streptomyces sp. NPDC060064]|uniref:hypothetical protein n=1 Tax=Streptomyces sp. NPDC060064 TaxID=3347049 RepID=UPI0036AA8F0C